MDQARALREALRGVILAHGALDDVRRPCGAPLSVPHAYALIELLQQGPMTVTALSERLNIDRTNVSRLCARMEAQGDLERRVHPEDRRARLVQLTQRGCVAARAVDATSAAHFEDVLARLGQESAWITEALTALVAALHDARRARTPEEIG